MTDINLVETDRNLLLNDKFNSLISDCNFEHLSYCPCKSKEVSATYKEYLDIELKDLKQRDLTDNKTVLDSRKRHALEQARREVARNCLEKNVKCELEDSEIKLTLQLFAGKFDLNDPRVYMVVKSVISHQLSVFRMQLQSNYRGILQQNVDKEGNPFYLLNPVEVAKMNFDNSIISAVEKLNKIVYGDKITNTNINVDVLSLREILGEATPDDIKKELIQNE